ncbi:transcriptional regulator [Vibrio sinensis]|uniref:Transcriptional regulator n=1 Tax=Vibrio sinensis TaxID=2302434 RepID=A0A3A6QW03_9VIBR|nr:HlyU family transcriptional regulator [Vibrio sinensis]RJX75478.1 transcriptional regulator [Vibrio sinensis]
MGLFSRLFGTKSKESTTQCIEPIEYKGFLIYPEALSESGQYRIAGRIERLINDELKSHRFIRSDVLSNEQDANDFMLKKAQLYIDQMNGSIFD